LLSRKFDNSRITQLSQRMNTHMQRYGYTLVDLPIIEPADLFLIKAGDQIVNRLFTFEHLGRQLALRPEFTAAAAFHYWLENGDNQPVTRWQFSGYVFDDNPNDFTQNRQRYSVGAELIGMGEPIADAEIVGMAVQMLIQEQLSDWQLRLGHSGLLRRALLQFRLDNRTERFLLTHLNALKNPDLGKAFVLDQLERISSDALLSNHSQTEFSREEIDLLAAPNMQRIYDIVLEAVQRGTTMGGRTHDEIARRLLQKRRRTIEHQLVSSAIDFLIEWGKIAAPPREAFQAISHLIMDDDPTSQAMLTDWRVIIDNLEIFDIPVNQITVQPDLARSWDYYTGMVFELNTKGGVQLGGGGRYDELSKLLGNKNNVPAVGFAYYMDKLITHISNSPLVQQRDIVICVDSSTTPIGLHWAIQLRNQRFMVQILTEAGLPEITSLIMYPDEDGTLYLNETAYRLEEISLLTKELNRILA